MKIQLIMKLQQRIDNKKYYKVMLEQYKKTLNYFNDKK